MTAPQKQYKVLMCFIKSCILWTFYLKVLLTTIYLVAKVNSNQVCPSESATVPKYHLIEKCYRSKLGVLTKAHFGSLISCQRLAIEKKGLSFNFSPPEANKGEEYTCVVLKCAEADGGQSLVNDTAFDYYSIYGKPVPNVNSTCVPAVGMFYLVSKHMNFTNAQTQCRNMSGLLSDVTSEQRTDALAQLLAGAGVEAAYTGLRRVNVSMFSGENGDTLECTTFRAWAPGHPRRNYTKYDCALITRARTWLSIPCRKTYPALCELTPGGPYRRGRIFKSRRVANGTTTPAPPPEMKEEGKQ